MLNLELAHLYLSIGEVIVGPGIRRPSTFSNIASVAVKPILTKFYFTISIGWGTNYFVFVRFGTMVAIEA